MISILPLRPEDLTLLDLQGVQRMWLGDHGRALDIAYGQELVAAGPAWSVTDSAGWPLAAVGFHMVNSGYAVAWALLAERLGMFHLPLTRAVRHEIATCGFRRVEALIRADHPAGARWARPERNDRWLARHQTAAAGFRPGRHCRPAAG